MMHKVLLIRFSAIGDLLLTAPVIRELKKEGAHITLMVKDQFRTTATLLEGVDALLSWEKDSKALLKTAATEYHRIIDLQGTAQSKRYIRKIKLPTSSFKKPYLRRMFLLLTRSKTFALTPVVERYAEAAGVMLPRDSDMQFAWCGTDIPDWRAPNALRRGDLVFWKGHVGIMTDSERLLHANAWHMAVAVEPLESAITRIANYYAEPIGARRIDVSSERQCRPDWLSGH